MILNFIKDFFDINLYHRFFFFLGTAEGLLFKRSLELLVFFVLSYMIISEYTRSHKAELKYLIIAFVSWMIQRFIIVFVYFQIVFGHLTEKNLMPYFPIIDHMFELFALILLINAFLYPYLKNKKLLHQRIDRQLVILIIISIFIEIWWLFSLFNNPYLKFYQSKQNILFVLIQVILIFYALFFVVFKAKKSLNERKNIFVAFSLYMLALLLHIANIIFFNNLSGRLKIVEQPLPLLAIILFMRIVYLRLVDKAYLEDKLAESERKYKHEKELSGLKDDFISTVSHELRTPITSMKLYLSLLLKGKLGKVNEKQEKAVKVVEDEANRLNNLINEILDLSKLESNKVKLNVKDFNLKELDKDHYFTLARQNGIKVKRSIGKGIVRGDPDKIKQILINLFSNAVKFTEKGKIIVAVKKRKKDWVLNVKDTGIGIKEEDIPNLFDKFHQLGSHMTNKSKGSGLGLSIVKMLVELHNGKIEVKSKVGKGSEFIVYFPLTTI